ncbi:MAG: hypothetical protein ACOZNI_35220 [Myxococcota bacterium]
MRAILLPFLLCAACADYALESSKDAGGDTASGAPDSDVDDTGTYTDPFEPDGWILRADLAVVGGVPAVEGATAAIDVVDTVAGGVACTIELDTTGLAAGEPPDEVVWAWWTLAVVPATDEPCVEPLPATLGLGVGALDGDVRAGLGAVGHDDVADSLYGAYLTVDDGTLWVFGYAGTDAGLAGETPASNPPGDGTYHLAPLYVLGLPE